MLVGDFFSIWYLFRIFHAVFTFLGYFKCYLHIFCSTGDCWLQNATKYRNITRLGNVHTTIYQVTCVRYTLFVTALLAALSWKICESESVCGLYPLLYQNWKTSQGHRQALTYVHCESGSISGMVKDGQCYCRPLIESVTWPVESCCFRWP